MLDQRCYICCTTPDDLDDKQQVQLKQVRTARPHLDLTANHVTEFAKILTNQGGEHLDEWMAAVEADDLPHLHRFVRGLRRDYDAVLNGLTLPHNSGAVEGNVNRIKMIKRQMYGQLSPPADSNSSATSSCNLSPLHCSAFALGSTSQ